MILSPAGTLCEVRGERAVVPRRVYRLCQVLGVPRPQLVVRRSKGRAGGRFICRWQHAQALLRRLGLVDAALRPRDAPPRRFSGARLAPAFLRGFFLGAGSVDDPARDHHLELELAGDAPRLEAALVQALAQLGLEPGAFPRRARRVVYLKRADAIVEFLGALGAGTTVLRYEEQRIRREVRAQVNRLVNAETANLGKAGVAGMVQVAQIRRLQTTGRLDALPAAVQAVAHARLAHPEASLRELGGLLDPPVGKSAVQYRLGVIRRWAGENGPDPGTRCKGGPAEGG